jgi:hypothetical protein
MRERSQPVREAQGPAVRASPTAPAWRLLLKAAAFAAAVGVFLAFVGAFGSEPIPPAARYSVFLLVSFVCCGLAVAVVWASERIAALAGRPWLRQAVVVALLTPATALAAWTIFGFAFEGAPRPGQFPAYLGTSFGMTIAMSLLSQVVFRRPPSPAAGSAPASTAPIPAQPVRFLERLPANLKGADLWAVEAEDHYVRLHTSRGSALILLRLADAAAELDGMEGARVHRSWWVARSAVAGAGRRGAQTVLKLPDGLEVPVSRSQAAELRRAGWW